MKIEHTQPGQINRTGESRQDYSAGKLQRGAGRREPQADSVSLSPELALVSGDLSQFEPERADRLNRIAEAVAAGSYGVDVTELSEALFEKRFYW
jgi:anti-sigma28 factor (negative regulator of flagellin synthesis)